MPVQQLLLRPFSWLYATAVWWRSKEYDWNLRKRVSFDLPVLCIGNLSAGGTGKTPHTAYLIQLLKDKYLVGVLSRGYGRKTKGYIMLNENMQSEETGDEPLLLKKKFPHAAVAVCEDRVVGIASMVNDEEELQVILLDDGFQHLAVQPLASIVLMDWNRPYFQDRLLPAGRLREPLSALQRADALIVTKCPETVTESEVFKLKEKLHLRSDQKFFLSALRYEEPYAVFYPEEKLPWNKNLPIVVAAGIADPQTMLSFLNGRFTVGKSLIFSDHHPYSNYDVEKMILACDQTSFDRKILLTTEKDAVRLAKYREKFDANEVKLFALRVQVEFLPAYQEAFHQYIFSILQ